jgi:type II secretory pathway pseudopilin PulG
MLCPKCGASNDAAATFCAACGEVLPLPAEGVQQARRKSDGPVDIGEYYKAALGPKNQEYYLSRFARFDADGKVSATWHWPAFFVTFYWMLYRKMWLLALIYFFFPYVFFGLMGATTGVTNGSGNFLIGSVYLIYLAGILLLVPMYANALYYKHCKKQISAAKASTTDVQRQLGELTGKGGTSNIVFIILLFLAFIALLGIVAAIAIPAYQDYTTKARVTQAYQLGKSAADTVSQYYNLNQELPNDLGEAGFASPLPPSVKEITMDDQYGTLTIIVNGTIVDGKSLTLEPGLDEKRQLYWSCTSNEIQDRYLPPACRQSN